MAHRCQQIIDAIADALGDNTSLNASVYKHRNASLNEDEQELPCVSVSIGADTPLADMGAVNMAYVDSLLDVEIVATVRADDEADAITALMDLRRQVHITLMADRSLGLSFVIDTRYGGADAPTIDVQADRAAARMSSKWAVHYRMSISDPQ